MRRHNISLQRTSARRVGPGFAAELKPLGAFILLDVNFSHA